jgi:hypothetical protein
VVPFGAVGAPSGYGALLIMATPAHGGGANLQCPGGTPDRHTSCPADPGGADGLPIRRPSVLGGSLRLRWSQHDTVVVVSVPGPTEANRWLLVTLADYLHLVRPTSG